MEDELFLVAALCVFPSLFEKARSLTIHRMMSVLLLARRQQQQQESAAAARASGSNALLPTSTSSTPAIRRAATMPAFLQEARQEVREESPQTTCERELTALLAKVWSSTSNDLIEFYTLEETRRTFPNASSVALSVFAMCFVKPMFRVRASLSPRKLINWKAKPHRDTSVSL